MADGGRNVNGAGCVVQAAPWREMAGFKGSLAFPDIRLANPGRRELDDYKPSHACGPDYGSRS